MSPRKKPTRTGKRVAVWCVAIHEHLIRVVSVVGPGFSPALEFLHL